MRYFHPYTKSTVYHTYTSEKYVQMGYNLKFIRVVSDDCGKVTHLRGAN